MRSISEIWLKNKKAFDTKSLSQILSFAGNGKLRDNNSTSLEFRELLNSIPSNLLIKFADNCLTDKIEDGGFALQDIINQVGMRLNFKVINGIYKGKQNYIGYDGIWKSTDNYHIIVEVKTTDAYRINLDTIAKYRSKLIDEKKIDENNSSILIVVGREDTGDLEAQIRGSKYAWNIRLISTDSLVKLLKLKEEFNDIKTIQQINQVLRPTEFTRIDRLIDLIFVTSNDLKIDNSIDNIRLIENKNIKSNKVIPVNFYEECINKIQNKLKTILIKQSRISFSNQEGSIGIICSISKPYIQGSVEKYWFAFHPHQKEYLSDFSSSYVAYGCGNQNNIFLIPFNIFKPLIKNMWTTEKENRMYWHVFIQKINTKYYLLLQPSAKIKNFDITKYKL